MKLVAKKCAIKTDGHFVFKNVDRPKPNSSASNLTGFSDIQSDLFRLNLTNRNENSLQIQLKGLSAAINMFSKRTTKITDNIISIYHDRALVLFHLKQFDKCVADATFIIEHCPLHSNAFLIRSRAYLAANRLYEAYDDILEACALEKFAENEINAMLTIIVKKIG